MLKKRRSSIILGLSFVFLLMLSTTVSASKEPLLRIQKTDITKYPKIDLELGLKDSSDAKNFKIYENGKAVKNIRATKLDSEKEPVGITLLIDISGSMAGQWIDGAKQAAKLFISQTNTNDRISIIAFNSTVQNVAGFSNDKMSLNKAIDSLQARGETAVYDALITGLNATKASRLSRNSVILLSDGGDTISRASGKIAHDLAGKAKIPVNVITLKSREYNSRVLSDIAKVSGGQVLDAASSKSLTGLYSSLAKELHNRYKLTYSSKAKGDVKLQIEADGVSGQQYYATSTENFLQKNKNAENFEPEEVRPTKITTITNPIALGVIIFIAVFLFILSLINIFRPTQNVLAEQLSYYDQLQETAKSQQGIKGKYGVKVAGNIYSPILSLIDNISSKRGLTEYARGKLEQAGLPLLPQEYMFFHLLTVTGLSLIANIIFGNLFFTILVVIFSTVAPLLLVDWLIRRRAAKFSEQLPDTLDLLGASLRAGYGLQQSIINATLEVQSPMKDELERISKQVEYGMDLQASLNEATARMENDYFRWAVLAISIHGETGGNLSEIFQNMAESLRERETLKRQVKALAAEGKLSGIILICLPFLEGGILFLINPEYMLLLFNNSMGVFMLVLALILMSAGAIWLKSITRVDY